MFHYDPFHLATVVWHLVQESGLQSWFQMLYKEQSIITDKWYMHVVLSQINIKENDYTFMRAKPLLEIFVSHSIMCYSSQKELAPRMFFLFRVATIWKVSIPWRSFPWPKKVYFWRMAAISCIFTCFTWYSQTSYSFVHKNWSCILAYPYSTQPAHVEDPMLFSLPTGCFSE